MRTPVNRPPARGPTIGFISTWPIYQGTTIDRYAHSLVQGISAAARERGAHLLLGCGFSVTGNSPQRRTFWPVPGPDADFVPVGPWNTDGLIIVPDDLSQEQGQYVQDLLASGFPVIFTTPEGPGPVVVVDNTAGIRQAFEHLLGHGHRQIAFIVGNSGRGGDSEERLRAYRACLDRAGLPEDPRLIAFGEHRKDGGAAAMQQILAGCAAFTALIASNDLSCLGAMQRLTEAGRRIPEDVAVVGFDDILDARALSPALTTVRHPTFHLGYQAVVTLLDYIQGKRVGPARVVIAPRLIVRQSCGCKAAGDTHLPAAAPRAAEPALSLTELARAMANAAWVEARNSLLEDFEARSARLLRAFVASLEREDAAEVVAEILLALGWSEARGEDGHLWQTCVAVIERHLNDVLALAPGGDPGCAADLLDRLRLEIGEQIQRQTTRAMLAHVDRTSQLGMMTAELLTAMDVPESAEILARHLPQVGIQNALVALYEAEDDDEVSQAVVLLSAGLPASSTGRRFEPRQFPVPGIYPPDPHGPLQLTILPLDVDETTSGFVAFQAPNPELCAAIVHNLIAALRISRLYRDAVDGRRLAEDASRLKARFLSMVSHELRSPLSLIVGLSEMVLREQRETAALAPGMAQDLAQINLSAQQLGRLLGDVLDLASSEAGQLRIIRQPLDLAEVVRGVAATGEQMARARGLGWQASLPAAGPWVFGDRTRLRQVVLNLISNAVKFSSQGEVCLRVETGESSVTVSVSDMGDGVAPEEQQLIFQEFYRSERSVRTGVSGLGLGLAVCQQLVDQHGGTIGLESPLKDGRGTRFYFTLPVMLALAPAEAAPVAPLKAAQRVVLLSAPTEDNQRLRQFLEGHGFEVAVCAVPGGEAPETEGLASLFALEPAAVVMDYGLAARQGWEIVSRIKRLAGAEAVPILVYTLNAAQDQGELLELDYLLKPMGLEQLAQELARRGLESQQTVLVVDDDPAILAIHSRMVEQAGYRVLQAANGQAALAAIERTRPDLILLDLIMPEMDGFALLEHLRARSATRDLPVIVFTGQALAQSDMERLSRGVAAILSKGVFSADETLARIEAALARQTGLSSTAQRFVRRAMAYIHARFGEPITRDEIARHVAISGNYLTDCFRQVLGVTPIKYLTRYRIERARQLLETSDLSITEIALETGFSELSQLTRTFKRELGVSPYAYRQGRRPAVVSPGR